MRTAVLGATGSIGALVVDRPLANGHIVAAVSRSAMRDREPDARLIPRLGDLTDAGFLREALAGCDAVISCLGQNRASKSLFAKRTSPPDILRQVAAATVVALGNGGQHLVYVSAFGVGATGSGMRCRFAPSCASAASTSPTSTMTRPRARSARPARAGRSSDRPA